MAFKKATKYAAKLRLALAGPSGSGKTYTALTLAHALADGKGVAVIDTERGSASKYADVFPEYDVAELDNFHPNNYIKAIREAEEAGYAVLVIDSLSHAWNGPGGLLELVEAITKRSNNKSSFNAWGEATPLQNRLIDSITRSKMHIICTMRTKTEYVIEQNERGKSAPRKVGTAPVQRADVEYEFDVYADLDTDNTLIVHKSRCSALAGAVISKPDASVAETLKVWLQGAPAPVQSAPPVNTTPVSTPPAPRNQRPTAPAPKPAQSKPAQSDEQAQAVATDQQKASIGKLCQHVSMTVPDLSSMTYVEAKALIAELTAEYRAQRAHGQQSRPAQQAPAPAASNGGQSKALLDMIAKAKQSIEELGVLWDDAKSDAGLRQVKDEDLTVQQVAAINKLVPQYEQRQAGKAS
jgi:hypothetical protein